MNRIFFALPENEELTKSLALLCNAELGIATIRHFPDGESFVQIESEVANKEVILICSLNQPDNKFLPLYFLSQTAKELGAASIGLVAPYLAYMRQDKRFHKGEGVTSGYYAKLISTFIDSLITINPHLHRIHSLSEIYSIPTKVIDATGLISKWILEHIEKPILIGPDCESEQWVSEVAKKANSPFVILQKIRKGDTNVEISVPHTESYINHTPVLVDDIISTARTMITTITHLKNIGMKMPVCIGIHGVFAKNAYDELITLGISQIATCNTIIHPSNKINIEQKLAEEILKSAY